MGLLDILAKLGILRAGAKAGTYGSAKDRPAEFLMDDVLDAVRDLTIGKDLTKPANVIAGSSRSPAPARFCTNCGAQIVPGGAFCTHCGKDLAT